MTRLHAIFACLTILAVLLGVLPPAVVEASPLEQTGFSPFETLSAGEHHTCAVLESGALMCWGRNNEGQLGDGTLVDRSSPVLVSGLGSGVKSVSVGGKHTCALLETGALMCWGSNDEGQLGDNTRTDRNTPVQVAGMSSGVVSVSAGYEHTCAVTNTGAARCWGRNDEGQLGDNSITDRLVYVQVSGMGSGVKMISAGYRHSCAVLGTGALKCWGESDHGQVGNGVWGYQSQNMRTPAQVTGLTSGVKMVSAGRLNTCAVLETGAVKCWGYNTYGQIGNGLNHDTYAYPTPTDVVGLQSGVQAVSLGVSQPCALLETGEVKCWGNNEHGQLGDGTKTLKNTPTSVFDISNAVAVTNGWYHTCAVLATGAVKCWGCNDYGKSGVGTAGGDYTIPTQVVGLESGVRVGSGGGLPVVGLVNTYYAVKEGDSLSIPVSLDVTASAPVRVNYTLSGGTATAADFNTPLTGEVLIGTGQNSANLLIEVADDTLVEGEETVTLTLSNPSGAILGTRTSAMLSIEDRTLEVGFSEIQPETEERGVKRIVVNLSNPAENEVFVEYYTSGGSAIAGEDYLYDMSGTLTFSPGETSKYFSIPIRNDLDLEGDETVLVRLRNPVGAALDAGQSVLTIKDNESDRSFSVEGESENKTIVVNYSPAPELSYTVAIQLEQDTTATLSMTPIEDPISNPEGFSVMGQVFDLELTDAFDQPLSFAQATVCFPYAEGWAELLGIPESELRLLHYENGQWVDITQSVDTVNNRICGVTTSFSPFAIVGEGGEIVGAGDTGDVTVIVLGSPLAVHPASVDFGSLALNGISHNLTAAPASPWQAVDPTGTGAGWHVNLRATDFLNGAGRSIGVENLSVSFTEVTMLAGNGLPVSQVVAPLSLSGADRPILTASAGDGMGSYAFTPSFGLFVPATTYAGSYTATLTATIVAGP